MSSKVVPKGNLASWSPYVKIYDPLKAGSIDGTDLIPHDNAVVRAMSAKYTPPDEQKVTSDPPYTLFVGRLNLRTSERQLTEEFSSYGQIKSCRLVQDIVTGMSRGYGFVEFKREADAQNAWKHAHGSTFHERKILVEWEFSRTMPGWIPRRLGGGLGGKKESGQLRFGGRDRPFKRPFILPPEEEDLIMSPENACSTKLPDNNVKAKGEKEHESSSNSRKTDTKELSFKNTYDDGRRKYGKYPEEKYSDHHEEDKRKYRREADDKYSNRGSYDQHRKYKRDKVDMYADSSQHEEGRRNSRRYWEDKSVGFEEEDQYRKKNRRGDGDKFADSTHEEGRKNSKRYVGDRSAGLEDNDRHRKKYQKENEDYYAHSSYYEESRRNSGRYVEEKSTNYENDSQPRKKYRKEQEDNYAYSTYYEEGGRTSRRYVEEKSTEYEDDQRRKKYRREHEDNYADSSYPRESRRISRKYHDDRSARYEDDPSYYEDDRSNSDGYFVKSSVGYEGDSGYLKDDYYEYQKKSSSRYVEGQPTDNSPQFTKSCSRRRNEEPRKRIEKDIESDKYSYSSSYYDKQSEPEIHGSVSRISNHKATCNDHSKRSSSLDSSISATHKKHKKSKHKKKRHHSDSSETDSPDKSRSTKMHKKKRKKERRGEEEIEKFR